MENNNEQELNSSFTMIDENGVEKQYDVLFTFESEETNKNYIAYTDNSTDADGKLSVFASTYEPNAEEVELKAIETDKEWKIIETVLESLQEEINKQNQNNEQ